MFSMKRLKLMFYAQLLLGCFTAQAYAGFPHGCEVSGFGYDGTNLVLNESGKQSYYLVQNRGSQPVELQRIEDPDMFMTPLLTARIQPENWAAFSSDVPHLYFQCFDIGSEVKRKIDCRESLDVCQYPRVKFALSNMGNYWVSIDKEQRQILNDSTAKGIYLRW